MKQDDDWVKSYFVLNEKTLLQRYTWWRQVVVKKCSKSINLFLTKDYCSITIIRKGSFKIWQYFEATSKGKQKKGLLQNFQIIPHINP